MRHAASVAATAGTSGRRGWRGDVQAPGHVRLRMLLPAWPAAGRGGAAAAVARAGHLDAGSGGSSSSRPAVGSRSGSQALVENGVPPDAEGARWQLHPPLQQQQQQQQQAPAPVFDPSALPIADRVKLLRNRIAARQPRRANSFAGAGAAGLGPQLSASELGLAVLSACSAAGVSSVAASLVLDHVVHSRVSGHPQSLGVFLQSYVGLAKAYGDQAALVWLRRAPSVIRRGGEVPVRLAQLQLLLGQASLEQVLLLTRRCPMVLGVEVALLAPRLEAVCTILRRPMHQQGAEVLVAAPALLAMQPAKLAAKARSLESLAATHPLWAEAYDRASATSLAVLLTYSVQRQQRLHFLAARGLQQRWGMSTVMALSARRMQQEFPEFDAWRARQQQDKLPGEQQASAAAVGGGGGGSSSSAPAAAAADWRSSGGGGGGSALQQQQQQLAGAVVGQPARR